MLVVEQTVEYVLLYLAGRAYATPRMAGFFAGMQVQLSPYVNRGGSFRASMTPSAYERPFDPYKPYDLQKAATVTVTRSATRKAKTGSNYYDYDPRTLGERQDSDEVPLITRR